MFSFFLLSFGLAARAQDYQTGLGVRISPGMGLTAKHFVKINQAIEGILTMRSGGFNVTGLYEIHANAFQEPGLNWFYGAGIHAGAWKYNRGYPWHNRIKDHSGSYATFGLDGIIGLEYTFSDLPLNLSLDWKPSLNLAKYAAFWGDEVALSVRFAFK